MRVSDIMTQAPACCTPESSLQEVAKMMLTHDCGCIPVCEDENSKRVVGMVTDRDIVIRAVAAGRNPIDLTVKDVMSHPVASVNSEAQLEECLQLMEENQVRRVPVVDHSSQLVGLVAQADIARRTSGEQTGELVQEISQGPDVGHS